MLQPPAREPGFGPGSRSSPGRSRGATASCAASSGSA
jgi:hypothetical protein